MSPPVSSVPTRSQIQNWNTSTLDAAAHRWQAAASTSEAAFAQHHRNISAPGGTTWLGNANDAALDRATTDLVAVRRHGDVQRAAAAIATRGSDDIRGARDSVPEAIAEAEADDFRAGEDLSVIDARQFDPASAVARATAATEHAEYIRWLAEQLTATDVLVGQQLETTAAELKGIPFDGEGDMRDESVKLVDHKVNGPYEGSSDQSTDSAAALSPQLGELLGGGRTDSEQPADLDDAMKEISGEQLPTRPAAVDQLLNQHAGVRKDERRYTRFPLEMPTVDADPRWSSGNSTA
ncbi:hypothetical protein ACQI4F_15655 [Mycolicibacterium vaccae]|uniref:hypothetical protein n=1 Tax=Mycolicibacterium vaccae TaxID=1810 RepID=UPI003CE7A7CB